jgi:hypothetical protein
METCRVGTHRTGRSTQQSFKLQESVPVAASDCSTHLPTNSIPSVLIAESRLSIAGSAAQTVKSSTGEKRKMLFYETEAPSMCAECPTIALVRVKT